MLGVASAGIRESRSALGSTVLGVRQVHQGSVFK